MADQRGPMGALGDNFQRAEVQRGTEAARDFDANQYSFFGDLTKPATNGALGGGLEEGLEWTPPEEEEELPPAALGDELESPMAGVNDDLGGTTDYTVASMFRPDAEPSMFRPATEMLAELDLDPALLEARSLPRDMFNGDDEMTGRAPGPVQRPQPYQEPQMQSTPPPAKRATPMTVAELEAQMAASTPLSQQPQQPPLHSPDMRPHMGGMPPHMMPPGMRPGGQLSPYPQFYHPNGAPPGMPMQPGMHPPGYPLSPQPHMGHAPGGPMHPSPMHPHPMHQPPMHPSPMHPGHMMSPSPGGGPHMFPPNMPPGMRPMMAGSPMQGGPGMHMQHMRPGPPHGMPGPPMMAWQQQHGPQHMGPPPPHMQPRMPPGMSPGEGHMQGPPMGGYPMPGGGPPHRPDFSPGPPHGGGGGGGSSGQGGGLSRSRFAGKLMSGAEVEHIMNILYAAVHAGAPYHEDYYYQAYVNQVTKGQNAAAFKPEELRSLRPEVARLDPSASVKFVAVHGLGKIVLGNIRTPKVLMDLTSPNAPPDADHPGATTADTSAPHRPLEQEPLLAARIMVEDCHDKLLDVDDIDRCFAASAHHQGGVPTDSTNLQARRALLATSVTAAFRLPALPAGAAADGPVAAGGDGVLLNIVTIPKGRAMLARSIRVLLARPQHAPPASALASPEHLLWALLRNLYIVFGASISDGNVKSVTLLPLVEATHRLAAAAKEAIQHLASAQQAADAMTAFAAGIRQRTAVAAAPGASPMEAVLPLAQVRILPGPLPESTPPDWCGDVIVALLQRGAQLSPEEDEQGTATHGAAWREGCAALVVAFRAHVSALAFLQQEMNRAARAEGGEAAPEALAAVRALACRPLAQQLLGLISDPANVDLLKQQLRQLL